MLIINSANAMIEVKIQRIDERACFMHRDSQTYTRQHMTIICLTFWNRHTTHINRRRYHNQNPSKLYHSDKPKWNRLYINRFLNSSDQFCLTLSFARSQKHIWFSFKSIYCYQMAMKELKPPVAFTSFDIRRLSLFVWLFIVYTHLNVIIAKIEYTLSNGLRSFVH